MLAAGDKYRTWALGRLRQAQERHEEAEAELAGALALARDTQEPLNRLLILLDLAESLEKLGRLSKLREIYDELTAGLPSIASLEGGSPVMAQVTNLGEKIARL